MRALGKRLGTGVVVLFAVIGVVATVKQLRGQTTAPLQGATFTHIGIVTKDIAKTTQMFADVYGVTPPTTVRTYDNNGKGIPFPPGIKGNTAAKGKLVQFAIGNVRVELIEPIDGPTAWSEQLDKHGMSIHHLAFQVPDVNTAVRGLEAKGGRWNMGEGGQSFAYVDMTDELGYTIEVGRQQPPAAQPAPPAAGAPAR
jgi:4-hydroxyphenylpyruvate dioxygenase-like putative hemolysin